MKIILLILTFLVLWAYGNSQSVVNRSNSTITVNDARHMASLNSFIPRYADTTSANVFKGIDSCGAIVYTYKGNTLWVRGCNPKRWLPASSGAGGISSFDFNTNSSVIICYSSGACDTIPIINFNSKNCDGVSPGGNVVTWSKTGLKFYVSAGNFSILCRNYFGESDSITLNVADPTNARFDVIYRDTSGAVGKITGTPAANPVLPQVNITYQVALTFVLVEAAATTPSSITNRLIYDENLQVAGGEWNTLATNINTFPNQTPIASNLIRSTFWNGVYALGAAYTNSGNIAVSSQDILWFKILFNGFNTYNPRQENIIALGLSKTALPVQLLKGVTYIKHGTNGFDTTNKSTWQVISIPLSQFLNPYEGYIYTLDSVYSLTISAVNNNNTGGGSVFYIDEINLQSGMVQSGAPPEIYVNDVYSIPGILSDTLFKVRNGDTSIVEITDRNCGVFSPGVVTWDSLLIFSISPSIYRLCCDGIRRTSAQTNVTLSASDPSLPRFDGIFLDSTGVVVVTGTPSATPAQPQASDCQLVLTYIYVPAGSTTPGNGDNGCGLPAQEIIYDETGGSEWTPATVGMTINFSNTTNPYHLIKSGDAGTFSASQSFSFTKGSNITLSDYSAVKFYIRLKSTWNPRTRFGIYFQNTTSIQPSRSVIMQDGLYNFSRTIVGSYQEITIPISEFLGGATNVVNKLYFLVLNTGNADGFYIDWIQLQKGICQPPVTGGAGTVTSVSSGSLFPLFTTTVTNPNTTPSLSFNLNSAAARTVFGRATGTGTPSYISLDTNYIANFSTMVRPLMSGGTGISYNSSTGVITNSSPGATYTASNGLTLSGSDFKLGGTLTENTTITGGAFGLISTGTSATVSNLDISNNSIGAGSIVNISSTSTAAASNLQKGLNIALSGANATSTQTTYGAYVSNTHDGTGSTNYGGYFTTSGGTLNYGVYGSGTYGVYGSGTNSGVYGTSGAGYALFADAIGSAYGLWSQSVNQLSFYGTVIPSSTNTVVPVMEITRSSTGTAANGMGGSLDFGLKTTGSSDRVMNRIISVLTDATDSTRTAKMEFWGVTVGTTQNWLTIGQSGYVKFRPMTVTEAGAITVAEGLMVFVSNTDATFTSIGLWIYQNGAWKAL